jgi:Uma2 family endonuclease
MVRCGPLAPDATSIDDPIALVEVVSKGYAQRDRWEKWGFYRRLPSLQHYVLVEREYYAVDVYDRVEGGFFERPRLTAASDALRLPAIDFDIQLAEIYRDVLTA